MSSSDDLNKTAKNPWNQIFMQYDYNGQKNEDYKISSSLKTIWNDASDNSPVSSNNNANNLQRNASEVSHLQACSQPTEHVQYHDKNVMAIRNGVQMKLTKPLGTVSENTMPNNAISNLLKGRAITARNGGIGIENQVNC